MLRPNQFHLRFTLANSGPDPLAPEEEQRVNGSQNLGVILCPSHQDLPEATVTTERVNGVEVAIVGNDLVMVNQSIGGTSEMVFDRLQTDALALLIVQGHRYEVRDRGVELSK